MQINEKRLLAEFLKLVQIDSFAGQEREMADCLTSKLVELNAKVVEDDAGKTIQGNAGNLIAKVPGNACKPTLLFAAHMDRVAPGFGIKPVVCDGHNAQKLSQKINNIKKNKKGIPHVFIANTIKGCGLKCMENIAKFHFRIPTQEELEA